MVPDGKNSKCTIQTLITGKNPFPLFFPPLDIISFFISSFYEGNGRRGGEGGFISGVIVTADEILNGGIDLIMKNIVLEKERILNFQLDLKGIEVSLERGHRSAPYC